MKYTQDRINVTHGPCEGVNGLCWAEIEEEQGRVIELHVTDTDFFMQQQDDKTLRKLLESAQAEWFARNTKDQHHE